VNGPKATEAISRTCSDGATSCFYAPARLSQQSPHRHAVPRGKRCHRLYVRRGLVGLGPCPARLIVPALRETPYRGASVSAVFENLLPDQDQLRRLVAERVGAHGTDAYSMLAKTGHDCVSALPFITGDDEAPDTTSKIEGEAVDATTIKKMLNGLSEAPLDLAREDAFRISVPGA
jgi:hypothetical protein